MRTIENLTRDTNEKVYVYLASAEIGIMFMKQAEAEGFTFSDGAKPTSRDCAEIMAVNSDRTISYVGSIGRMAFGSGTENIGKKKLVRVDYEKYCKGDSDSIQA